MTLLLFYNNIFTRHTLPLQDIAGIKVTTRPTLPTPSEPSDEDTQAVLQASPILYQLQYLEVGEGSGAVRVIREVASKWEQVADCLRFSPGVIAGVRENNPRDCDKACRRILELWLNGDRETRQPVTWNTLLQTLRETDPAFEPLADQLKYALLHPK